MRQHCNSYLFQLQDKVRDSCLLLFAKTCLFSLSVLMSNGAAKHNGSKPGPRLHGVPLSDLAATRTPVDTRECRRI